MGVTLDARHDPMPTEEELARLAGLVPGDIDQKKLAGWIAMMIFLAELGLGLAYAWKKGALEWE